MDYSEFTTNPQKYSQNEIPYLNNSCVTEHDINNKDFITTQDHCNKYKGMVQTASRVMKQETNGKLRKLFFSSKNMKRLQKQLRKEIFISTNGKYKMSVDQDKNDLLVIMISVFKNHALHSPKNIIRQTKNLNKIVIETILPDIITNIKQYYSYLSDINKPLEPIARPVNMSNKGRRIGESITTTFI